MQVLFCYVHNLYSYLHTTKKTKIGGWIDGYAQRERERERERWVHVVFAQRSLKSNGHAAGTASAFIDGSHSVIFNGSSHVRWIAVSDE